MKALTLTQPWAQLIARGEKRIETRSWSTNYRGPLAIHAAKGLGGLRGSGNMAGGQAELEFRLRWLVQQPPFCKALGGGNVSEIIMGLPMGCIVATCNLVQVVPTSPSRISGDLLRRFTEAPAETSFGDYAEGRYAWILDDVTRLHEPIPARGRQQLWEPDYSPELHLAAMQLEDARMFGSPRCLRCGCTNNVACGDGCGWASLDPPVCTACV